MTCGPCTRLAELLRACRASRTQTRPALQAHATARNQVVLQADLSTKARRTSVTRNVATAARSPKGLPRSNGTATANDILSPSSAGLVYKQASVAFPGPRQDHGRGLDPGYARRPRVPRVSSGGDPWGSGAGQEGVSRAQRRGETMREGGAEKNGADLRGAPEGFEPSTGFGPPRSLRNGNGIPDSEWEGWGDWEDEPNTYNNDWVSQERWPEGIPPDEAAYLRREERRRQQKAEGKDGRPRDEFLRPMIDTIGIQNRLSLDSANTEDKVREEFEANQYESRMGIQFAGILVVVPLLAGFTLSRLLAEPFFEVAQAYNPDIFHPTPMQRAEGGRAVHRHQLRLRMEAAIGRIPPLSDDEMQVELREEAYRVKHELEEDNKRGWLNLLSDGTTASVLFSILCVQSEGRRALFSTIGRFMSGMSDTAKAFLIIAGTDVFLGYHSEEGWTAAIHLLTKHYGYEVEEAPIYIFVAIVPVVMDAFFKLWIFNGLNRQSPAAAVTLKQMDRH